MTSWEFFDYLLKNANVVGTPGSGFGLSLIHIYGKNIFADPDDVNGLSEDAYHFIGGLLAHSEEMAAITTVSYTHLDVYKRQVYRSCG